MTTPTAPSTILHPKQPESAPVKEPQPASAASSSAQTLIPVEDKTYSAYTTYPSAPAQPQTKPVVTAANAQTVAPVKDPAAANSTTKPQSTSQVPPPAPNQKELDRLKIMAILGKGDPTRKTPVDVLDVMQDPVCINFVKTIREQFAAKLAAKAATMNANQTPQPPHQSHPSATAQPKQPLPVPAPAPTKPAQTVAPVRDVTTKPTAPATGEPTIQDCRNLLTLLSKGLSIPK